MPPARWPDRALVCDCLQEPSVGYHALQVLRQHDLDVMNQCLRGIQYAAMEPSLATLVDSVCAAVHRHANGAAKQRFLGALLHGFWCVHVVGRDDAASELLPSLLSVSMGPAWQPSPDEGSVLGPSPSVLYGDVDGAFSVPLERRLFDEDGGIIRTRLSSKDYKGFDRNTIDPLVLTLEGLEGFGPIMRPSATDERTWVYRLEERSAVALLLALRSQQPWILYDLRLGVLTS